MANTNTNYGPKLILSLPDQIEESITEWSRTPYDEEEALSMRKGNCWAFAMHGARLLVDQGV